MNMYMYQYAKGYDDTNQIGIQSEYLKGFRFNYITKWIQINLFHIYKGFETIEVLCKWP